MSCVSVYENTPEGRASHARATAVDPSKTTVAQNNQRHLGEGGRPSGSKSRPSVKTRKSPIHSQFACINSSAADNGISDGTRSRTDAPTARPASCVPPAYVVHRRPVVTLAHANTQISAFRGCVGKTIQTIAAETTATTALWIIQSDQSRSLNPRTASQIDPPIPATALMPTMLRPIRTRVRSVMRRSVEDGGTRQPASPGP